MYNDGIKSSLPLRQDTSCTPHDSRFVFWSTQSDDLLFDAETEIITLQCRTGLRSVALDWKLCRNQFQTSFEAGQAEAIPGNRFIIRIPAQSLIPGFYDLHVSLDSGKGDLVPGVCTFGYAVDTMPIADTRPDDFMEFWTKGLAELESVPLNAALGQIEVFNTTAINEYNVAHTCIPADYDPHGRRFEAVESCKVSFDGLGDKRLHASLAKPEGEGPFRPCSYYLGRRLSVVAAALDHWNYV